MVTKLTFLIDKNGNLEANIKWPQLETKADKKQLIKTLRKFILDLQTGRCNASLADAVIANGKRMGQSTLANRILDVMIIDENDYDDEPVVWPGEIDF
jgi:hypothetical protein